MSAPAGSRLPAVSEVVEGTVEDEGVHPPEPAPSTDPVPAGSGPLAPQRPPGDLVRTQAAAVAATGFAVGAVTAVAIGRRRARRAARKAAARPSLGRDLANVVASRSFLVDVHLLAPKK